MRDLIALIGFIVIIVCVMYRYNDKHIELKKEVVIEYKDKLIPIRDTITKVEVRLQKAKEIHDTIEIIKQQDTLIKFLKVEVKVQDTIIKFQDTIIYDCEKQVKKERKFKKIAILGATILGIGLWIK